MDITIRGDLRGVGCGQQAMVAYITCADSIGFGPGRCGILLHDGNWCLGCMMGGVGGRIGGRFLSGVLWID